MAMGNTFGKGELPNALVQARGNGVKWGAFGVRGEEIF